MQNKKKQNQTTLFQFINGQKIDQKKPVDLKNLPVDSKNSSVDSNLSNKSDSGQISEETVRIDKPALVNVEFYRNLRISEPNGDFINKIHQKWWGNYQLLERHHGFIQWLFPNSFSSRFNSQSAALCAEEQNIFRTDLEVATKYVRSYEMMLQFYGMKLKSKITGQITQQRRVNFKQRYYATLLTSFHNHMRITRMLCSLTMIGFGRYAKQLSQFLHSQIRSQKGNLVSLAKYNVDKDWNVYRNYIQTQEDLNVYLKENFKKTRIPQQKCQDKLKQVFQKPNQNKKQTKKQKNQQRKQHQNQQKSDKQ